MDLSIIIVNYNSKDVLKKCLNRIQNSKDTLEKETIVVDNASTDDSIEMIKKDLSSQDIAYELLLCTPSDSKDYRHNKAKYIRRLIINIFNKGIDDVRKEISNKFILL